MMATALRVPEPRKVVPFPLTRRRDFVAKQAARIAAAPPITGEKLLGHALKVQADTMGRRGIDPTRIAHELRALETAIRCEMWKLILMEGGAT